MISKLVGSLVLIGALTAGTASAQSWDTSGNGLLNGSYYIRQVAWWVGDEYGDLGEGTSVFGVITFDGNGNYTFNGQLFDEVDTGSASPVSYTGITGTYSISASGYGFMDSLITDDSTYGLVSNGIFIGSSTENSSAYNDMVVAAPLGSSQATNGTLSGSYAIADMEYPAPVVDTEDGWEYARDSLTTFNADGNGNLSSITARGYIAGNYPNATTQSIGSAKYAFSNGAANLEFSGSYGNSNIGSTLMVGSHYLYISPDGNFVFGGSPQGYDMFVGTRTSAGTSSNFNGLYYQAGMDLSLTEDGGDEDSYFGSFYANAGGVQNRGLGHQRYAEWIYDGTPIDLTYADTYSFSSGASTDTGTNYSTGEGYVFGNNGAIRIGLGQASVDGVIGISVALQAPSLSGGGVYLNPTGILNAASSALFTASLSPGELVTLSGTNLAPSGQVTSNFATSLNGVQILFNGTPAPVYYVYPNVVAAIVPYEISPGDIVDIQVNNNGQLSNTISTFAQQTQPGLFTNPPGGIGLAITQHSADYSLITSSNPAQIGETIVAYLTGLGPVSPSIIDGTAGGSNPTSTTTNTMSADLGGVSATVGYAGLVPSVIALYQMNITIPSGVATGNVNLDITGPDSYSTEAYIPISTVSSAVPATAHAATPHRARPLLKAKGAGTRHIVPHGAPRDGFTPRHPAMSPALPARQ